MPPATALGVAQPSTRYEPRHPAQRVLHQIVREHFETFRAQAAVLRDGKGLPRLVEQEFRDFLTCGCLAAGFARFRCHRCGLDRLVPFSCKGRGYAECWNMRSRRPCDGQLVEVTRFSRRQALPSLRILLSVQGRSDAISASGGRNFPGRSWGGVTDWRTPIRSVTSTRR